MKLYFTICFLAFSLFLHSQKQNFNKKLITFCNQSVLEFSKIPAARKLVLDSIAKELSTQKGIVFTCYTNTRRTQLLQTWMQTAFYFYSIHDKMAFSYGDTISDVASEVVDVLKKSGFYVTESNTKPKIYVLYTGEKNIGHVIYSKNLDKSMITNGNVVVSVCAGNEPTSSISSNAYSLEYVSPVSLGDISSAEFKTKHQELNKQISVETLYLASKTREFILGEHK